LNYGAAPLECIITYLVHKSSHLRKVYNLLFYPPLFPVIGKDCHILVTRYRVQNDN
jgi:hypothetical protein